MGFVLGQHDDAEIPGVHHIRQGEVNQAIVAPERHRRFGAVLGQGHESLAFSAG